MASYLDFVGSEDGTTQGLILDWANRDDAALPRAIRTDVLRWAADQCYSLLRVPPLELTRTYTIDDNSDISNTDENRRFGGGQILTIPVPTDMIEVIYIRERGTGIVYEEKVDNRTLYNTYADTKLFNFWTRVGNNFKLHGRFRRNEGDTSTTPTSPTQEIEIHYYRRLPAMNAQYAVTAASFNAQTSIGQLMTQQNPEDPTSFITFPGNGVLYFEEFEPITVDNFLLGLNTAVPAGALGIDGSLWFRPADVDWTVVADNWNNFGMDNNDRISWAPPGSVFTGTLWFDPSPETDDLQVPAGNNQVFTNEVVLGGNSGITRVARIRQGSEVELTLGTDYILELRDDGRVNVIFSGTVSTSDIYLVSYDSRPANPYFQTAFTSNNAAGTRTAFNFIGSLNLDEVNSPTTPFTTANVSDMRTDEFSQQVFFIGMDELGPNRHPVPGMNTAFDLPTADANVPFYYTGNEIQHWLRDENERIVLFGALAEAFAYLQEDDMHQKYKSMFVEQIELINREEKMRVARGGNISVSFNGGGLI